VDNRRRAERQFAVWIGTCQVEGDPDDTWRDCGVFDVSALGVGMDVRYPDASELIGRHVTVRLPVGASMDMTLTGVVRNSKAGPGDVVRSGIEFVDLSDSERSVMDLLERHVTDDQKPEA
jgi:glycine cleavage system aminomethyltransferase T